MRTEVDFIAGLIVVVGIVVIVFNAIPKRKATLRSDTPVLRLDDE